MELARVAAQVEHAFADRIKTVEPVGELPGQVEACPPQI